MKSILLLGLALAQMYVPPANVEYFEHGHVIRDNATPNPLEILSEKYQIPLNQIKIQKEYTDSDNIKHVYGIRILNGIPVMNQNFAIHFKDGKVLAISSSYRPTAKLVKRQTESIDLSRAVEIAEKQFGIKRDDFPAQKVYLQTSPEQLTLVHQFQLRDDDQNKWFQVSVDTVSGKVVESIDYVHHATFDAIDFRKPDVLSGFEEFVNPEFTTSSPFGWNSDGTETFNETRGNNVDSIVYGQAKAEQRATGDNLKFDSQFDSTQEIDTEANLRAATINSFYLVNTYHDILYQYGFTEIAGNFQKNNRGLGGDENDEIIVRNLDVGRLNDATFASPADGQKGILTIYRWTRATPNRSGAFDNTLMAHEAFHGVSIRLTGGSRDSKCLLTTDSRGMGEGWSDFFALLMASKETDTRSNDRVLGTFVNNSPGGIRTNPYSTDMSRNPLTYGDLPLQSGVHRKGTVWATVLNEIYWNLVDKFGFSGNWYDPQQEKGNIITLDLVLKGLKIQPCNPTFLQSRDAIITSARADMKCDVWKGFAKRGFGFKATEDFVNDFTLPDECGGITTQTATATVGPTSTVQVTVLPTSSIQPEITQLPVSLAVQPTTISTVTPVAVPTAVPTIPSVAPPVAPTVPSISFGSSGAPRIQTKVTKGTETKIQVDTTRLTRVCDNISICYYKMFQRATCKVIESTKRGLEEFDIVFPDSGNYNVYIESQSPGCSSSDRNWNRMGYSVRVE